MIVMHLATSPFFGGPERLMVGLSQSLGRAWQPLFCLFADRGKSQAFRRVLAREGLEAVTLAHDSPHAAAMVTDLAERLQKFKIDVLCCHGYKADIVGLLAVLRRDAGDRPVAWLDRRDVEGACL